MSDDTILVRLRRADAAQSRETVAFLASLGAQYQQTEQVQPLLDALDAALSAKESSADEHPNVLRTHLRHGIMATFVVERDGRIRLWVERENQAYGDVFAWDYAQSDQIRALLAQRAEAPM